MSRFSNLEFDKPVESGEAARAGESARDEYYFHAQGCTAWLAGDFENALLHFSRSLEERNTFYEGWFGQLRMLIELREYPEAQLWSEKALKLFPGSHELLAAVALAAAREGNAEKARKLSDKAMEGAGATWYVWLARAEVLHVHRHGIVEACIRNACSDVVDDVRVVQLEAGRVLARCGLPAVALEYLGAAAAGLRDSALAWYELGRCQATLGLPAAGASLSQCLAIRPHWPEAQTALRRAGRPGWLSWFTRRL